MKTIIKSIKAFIFFTVLTGIFYPLLVTGVTQVLFPLKVNGSLIIKNNQIIGSELIGQQFDSAIYFTSRPSAISYNPLPSGGSNFGLTNSILKKQVIDRKQEFIEFNQLDSTTEIPSEMLFASASGLDPHISKQSALLQINRIGNARNFSNSQKQRLIDCVIRLTEKPEMMVLGEERVNVLLLNLELDKLN